MVVEAEPILGNVRLVGVLECKQFNPSLLHRQRALHLERRDLGRLAGVHSRVQG